MTDKALVAAVTVAASLQMAVAVQAQTPTSGQDHAKHAQTSKGHEAASMGDAEFVTMTIKHHQDGIAMARLEEKGGASSELKALAAKIRQGQEREVPELRKHEKAGATSVGSGHAEHMKKMEAESQRAMQRLRSASGAELDQAFVDEMAKHHQQAIDMVGRTNFSDAELRAMAQKMAANQKQELADLRKHQKTASR